MDHGSVATSDADSDACHRRRTVGKRCYSYRWCFRCFSRYCVWGAVHCSGPKVRLCFNDLCSSSPTITGLLAMLIGFHRYRVLVSCRCLVTVPRLSRLGNNLALWIAICIVCMVIIVGLFDILPKRLVSASDFGDKFDSIGGCHSDKGISIRRRFPPNSTVLHNIP